MLPVFDFPIDFPYFSLGAFGMGLPPLEKETLSDLRYQNLCTWANAMPAQGLQPDHVSIFFPNCIPILLFRHLVKHGTRSSGMVS